jgi:hypothetical protein
VASTAIRRIDERSNNVEAIAARLRFFGKLAQKAGPYLLLEILLPGGTILALLLYAYQRKQSLPAALIGVIQRVDSIVDIGLGDIASLWRGRHRERDGLEALAMAASI